MWVISGPFDGKENGVVDFTKQKLLKCGRTYPLGRKAKHPLQLVVNHPKVSGEHFSLIVGEHPTEDINNLDARPTLNLFNHRNKIAYFERPNGGGRMTVNPLAQSELQDGDEIVLIVGTMLRIQWRSVICYLPPKSPSFSFEHLAHVGIKVTSSPSAAVSHHLTPNLTFSPSIVSSLVVGAQIVRPDWLTEVLRLGDGDDITAPYETSQASASTTEGVKSCPLEREFALPSESRFRPAFAPTLPAELKKFQVWEPKEARIGMLKGWRFVFLMGTFSDGSSSRSPDDDAELRKLIESAGAEYETFDVSGGRVRLKQAIGRCVRRFEAERGGAVREKGLAVVSSGEVERVRASVESGKKGGKEWDEVIEVLENFGLRIVAKDTILQSIIDIDVSKLDSFAKEPSESKEPTPAPSSDLPAPPPTIAPTRKSTRSAPSTEAALSPLTPVEPSPEDDTDAAPARKRPVRRVTRSRANTPAPDVNMDVAPAPALPTPAPSAGVAEGSADGAQIGGMDSTAAGPPRRALTRRRAGARATTPLLLGVGDPSFASSSQAPTPAHNGIDDGSEAASSSAVPEAQAGATDASMPPPPTLPRSSRLKRRLRTDSSQATTTNPVLAALQAEAREVEEMNAPDAPPLKKFKALFEETDPDRMKTKSSGMSGTSGAGVYSGGIESQIPDSGVGGGMSQSQFGPTQTQTQARVQQTGDLGTAESRLPALMEEDENAASSQAQSGSGGTATVDGDIEMASTEDGIEQTQARTRGVSTAPEPSATQTQRKQVAFSSTAARSKSVQPSLSNADDAPRGPDTDAAFLKALSQKRSKTAKSKSGEVDDAFDRDFNNLRIVKPDLDGARERALEREREEWKVLAEFGDDTDVRGNFMVVVEIDVPERHKEREGSVGHASGKLSGEGRSWQGKPDFKKFKKRATPRYMATVDLLVTQENDFGVGTSYWKGSNTQSQNQSQSQPTAQSQLADTSGFGGYKQTQSHLQPSQVDNSPHSQNQQQQGRSSKPPSKSQVKPPSKSRTQIQAPPQAMRRGKSRGLQADESDKDEGADSEMLSSQPRATRKGRSGGAVSSTTTKGKAPARGKAREKSQPLFLASEGDEDHEDIEDFEERYIEGLDEVGSSDEEEGEGEPTLRSRATGKKGKGTAKTKAAKASAAAPSSSIRKKRPAEVLDDDADDGLTFGGFGGRKRTRAK